jgi:hypothetical protein
MARKGRELSASPPSGGDNDSGGNEDGEHGTADLTLHILAKAQQRGRRRTQAAAAAPFDRSDEVLMLREDGTWASALEAGKQGEEQEEPVASPSGRRGVERRLVEEGEFVNDGADDEEVVRPSTGRKKKKKQKKKRLDEEEVCNFYCKQLNCHDWGL